MVHHHGPLPDGACGRVPHIHPEEVPLEARIEPRDRLRDDSFKSERPAVEYGCIAGKSATGAPVSETMRPNTWTGSGRKGTRSAGVSVCAIPNGEVPAARSTAIIPTTRGLPICGRIFPENLAGNKELSSRISSILFIIFFWFGDAHRIRTDPSQRDI
jgi:hypothetical protein